MNRKEALTVTGAVLGCTLRPLRAVAGVTSGSVAITQTGIPVAFIVGPRSNLIDIAGPMEVFGDMYVSETGQPPANGADSFAGAKGTHPVFAPYVVSDTLEPITAGRVVTITPNYTFANAPAPKIIVMGAQSGHSPAKVEWIREMARTADVVMSVCTGAYLLADTGLLDGKRATTHHDFYDDFAATYPKVQLIRGPRFVDDGQLKTAGGLTSGIGLALHVVSQMYDEARAAQVARYLEYVRTERPT
ncbi:MAG: DJ-1/PfpI family protein [Candidatus Eremiobacteraeota bacterium]|nr:DJ-1/PfpI family protein [Candidatus Eremiobacteraeota bacterium]